MESRTYQQQADEIGEALKAKLRLRGRDLDRQAARARRALSRRLRADIRTLSEAAAMEGHPKLSRRIDAARVAAAHARLSAHLGGVDPRARARAAMLDVAAAIALAVLLAGILIVWWLWSTGRV
ncbi:hypothetical protein [Wenxinia saemankumensis]|uniref:Uncharacterized protein n=1 Tax=Wenxinia saemankumensis TaxID=1447782 RepID=A0A1M6ETF3_9RHOB|nr:hypothetical protein [Wenxinia saemankumensis]SHI88771.1 hypothetical protein SAMN05444417_2166 [Wenxinia saemankumensis]